MLGNLIWRRQAHQCFPSVDLDDAGEGVAPTRISTYPGVQEIFEISDGLDGFRGPVGFDEFPDGSEMKYHLSVSISSGFRPPSG